MNLNRKHLLWWVFCFLRKILHPSVVLEPTPQDQKPHGLLSKPARCPPGSNLREHKTKEPSKGQFYLFQSINLMDFSYEDGKLFERLSDNCNDPKNAVRQCC